MQIGFFLLLFLAWAFTFFTFWKKVLVLTKTSIEQRSLFSTKILHYDQIIDYDYHEMPLIINHVVVGKIFFLRLIDESNNQLKLSFSYQFTREADGVMVARGDLGVEIDIEDLPNVQRNIVRLCAIYGKRVIIATHLLESMIENPIPTRAEVTDVANAIYEEADAIMLSGETTVGKYPVKCIEYMNKIVLRTETFPGLNYVKDLIRNNDKQNLAASAVQLA